MIRLRNSFVLIVVLLALFGCSGSSSSSSSSSPAESTTVMSGENAIVEDNATAENGAMSGNCKSD